MTMTATTTFTPCDCERCAANDPYTVVWHHQLALHGVRADDTREAIRYDARHNEIDRVLVTAEECYSTNGYWSLLMLGKLARVQRADVAWVTFA